MGQTTIKTLLKWGLLRVVSRLTGRTAVLLPREAARDWRALTVRAPYRVEGEDLTFEVAGSDRGNMTVRFSPRAGPRHSALALLFQAPERLRLRLRDGTLWVGEREFGSLSGGAAITCRRFEMSFEIGRARRVTSHYLPRDGEAVTESYYAGEDYVDYDSQSEVVHQDVLDMLTRHGVKGSVLDVGCATGGTMAGLRRAGFEVTGVDFSDWAVERGRERLGDVVYRCDIEREPIPTQVRDRAPFNAVVLSGVVEHFEDPAAALTALTPLVAPGALLCILTSNGNSLSRRVFGRDWEGYFDWTHKGVDRVTVPWLRATLDGLGWRIAELQTWHVWQGSHDPAYATFRDWLEADARFRALLVEHDLGDFIRCVAVKNE